MMSQHLTRRPGSRQLPTDHVFGAAAMRQPRPPQAQPPRKPKRPRKRNGTARVISLEASLGLHLAVFLVLWALPKGGPAPAPVAKAPEIIPIEVAFIPTPIEPAPVAENPGLPQEAPEQAPKAVERPAPPKPQQAATTRQAPPKPAVQAVKPAPKPQQKEVVKPKAPDLQALLDARKNRGSTAEDQRLAALRDQSRTGAQNTPDEPGAGQPQGAPVTDGSSISGAIATRQVLRRVNPAYPEEAQHMGEEGEVRVRIYVTPQGSVSKVELVTSSGRGYFDRAAMSAMRRWAFNPLADASGGEQFGEISLYFKLQ
jgi:protein TonB